MCVSALSAKLSRSSASPCLNSLNASVSVISTSSALQAELVAGVRVLPSRGARHIWYFHHSKVRQEVRRNLYRHPAEEPPDACFCEERCEKFSHCRHSPR